MTNKRYMINDDPASAEDIICLAKTLSANYGSDGVFTTSEGAKILRDNGYKVNRNPLFSEDIESKQ